MESTDQRMPYAPASAILTVIRRYRDRGLPEPITTKTLHQVQVSEGNAPRTLQALKLLNLIDDDGNVTDAFERVRQVSTAEYPAALADIIQNAYHSIFTIIDPAQDDFTAVEDAFRYYEPKGQRQRMVKLFLSLCDEAGLIPEDKREDMQLNSPQANRRQSAQPSSKRVRRTQSPKSAQQPKRDAQQDDVASAKEKPPFKADEGMPDYPAITVLMQQLPKDGRWTNRRRGLWIQAMVSAVDLSVEVVDWEDQSDRVYEGEVMPELELES